MYNESFTQTLLIPIRAFFQGKDNNPKYFDGKLNPFLLMFTILAFVRFRKQKIPFNITHRSFLCIFALSFTLFVYFRVDYRIRYMAPAIPPLIVLSMFGIRKMVQFVSVQTSGWKKAGVSAVTVLICGALFYNWQYLCGQFDYIRPIEYLTREVDRGTYISRYNREFPVIRYANQVLPENAKVLCLSIGDRTYYLERNALLSKNFFQKKGGKYSKKELLKSLRKYGTSHIIVDQRVLFNWIRHLSKSDQSVFLDVFKSNTKTLYRENDVLLLELLTFDDETINLIDCRLGT